MVVLCRSGQWAELRHSDVLEFLHTLIGQFELKPLQAVGAAVQTASSNVGNSGSVHWLLADTNCYGKSC